MKKQIYCLLLFSVFFAPELLSADADVNVVYKDLASESVISKEGAEMKLIKIVNPEYPAWIRNAGIKGTVVISYYVNTDGAITGAKVAKSVYPELDLIVLKAVQSWRYAPYNPKGAKLVRLQSPVTFELNLPHQALEPTIPGVTPRAEPKPRIAPPGIVAPLRR